MKKLNIFVSAFMIAITTAGALAQQITGSSSFSPTAGGARILSAQGDTPANPAIGFHSTVSTTGTANNDGGGGNGIFRPTANVMAFATGSLERMRITSGGQIGIGVLAPTARFHTLGTVRLESLPSSTVNSMVISTDANGNLSYQPASSLFPSSTNWLLGGNSPSSGDFIGTLNAEPFKIFTSGSEKARITSTGEMGIGTIAPSANLDVTSVGSTMQTAIKGLGINTGVYGEATAMNAALTDEGTLASHTEAIGVFGKGNYVSNLANGNIFGVVGSATAATNPLNNVGVYGEAKNASGYNTGVYGGVTYGLDYGGIPPTKGIYNSGVAGKVELNKTAIWNRAINGLAPVAPNHYAGYFDGHVSVMTGNVGINTEANRHKLNVHDGALMLSGNVAGFGGPQLLFSDDTTTHPNGKWAIEYIKPVALGSTNARPSMGGLNFWKPWNVANVPGHAYNYSLFLKDDGKIGMGVSDDTDPSNASLFRVNAFPDGYRLYVNGGILTTKVKVANYNSAAWADYVFAKDYKLKSLSEVETFIKANKHLPNIPSGDQIEKEGLDLADMQAKQMEKIEELTLYMIEMKKEIDALKKQNESLKGNISKN